MSAEQSAPGQEQGQAFSAEAAQQAATGAEAAQGITAPAEIAPADPLDFAEAGLDATPNPAVKATNVSHGRLDGSTEVTAPKVEPGKDPLDF